VLYGGIDQQSEKLYTFFSKEKKARGVYVLNGTLNDFFLEYPFRCNGANAPPDTHDIYPSQILDFLFLGSQQNASSRDQFVNLKIQRVLNCASLEVPNSFNNMVLGDVHKCIKYHGLPIDDDPSQDLTKYLGKATHFIEQAKKKRQIVLVHCRAGKSRSVSIVIAYLITYQNMSFKEAYDHVKTCRPNIDINSGFLDQLQALKGILEVPLGQESDSEDNVQ